MMGSMASRVSSPMPPPMPPPQAKPHSRTFPGPRRPSSRHWLQEALLAAATPGAAARGVASIRRSLLSSAGEAFRSGSFRPCHKALKQRPPPASLATTPGSGAWEGLHTEVVAPGQAPAGFVWSQTHQHLGCNKILTCSWLRGHRTPQTGERPFRSPECEKRYS